MGVPLELALGVDMVVDAEGSTTGVRRKFGEGVTRGACVLDGVPAGIIGVVVDLTGAVVESVAVTAVSVGWPIITTRVERDPAFIPAPGPLAYSFAYGAPMGVVVQRTVSGGRKEARGYDGVIRVCLITRTRVVLTFRCLLGALQLFSHMSVARRRVAILRRVGAGGWVWGRLVVAGTLIFGMRRPGGPRRGDPAGVGLQSPTASGTTGGRLRGGMVHGGHRSNRQDAVVQCQWMGVRVKESRKG